MEYSRLQIVTAFGLMDGFKDSCGQDLKKKNAILSGCAHMESDIWAWGAHSWSVIIWTGEVSGESNLRLMSSVIAKDKHR